MEVTLLIRATIEEITPMLDLLAERGYIQQEWGREVISPLPQLEGLPPESQLTPMEHAIVQHDLLGSPRRDISRALGITPETITIYRRNIRKKLRHLQPEQRPVPITNWLRRFPGRPTTAEAQKKQASSHD